MTVRSFTWLFLSFEDTIRRKIALLLWLTNFTLRLVLLVSHLIFFPMSSPRALSDPFIWFKLEVLCFRPWIRIWSRIFIPLLILDTDSDPVKSGIITPIELLWFWPWISIQSRIFSLLATWSISRIGLCVFKFGFTTYVTLKDVVRAHMASKIRPKARRQTQGRWVVCAYSHSMITLANLIGRTCTPCITLRAPFILLTANPIRLFIIISLRPIHHPVKTPVHLTFYHMTSFFK